MRTAKAAQRGFEIQVTDPAASRGRFLNLMRPESFLLHTDKVIA
jgi:hypothetical protein